VKQKEDTPYFIHIRGCINCDQSKKLKERTGHDYGFDHELIAGCLILGCFDYGHDLSIPYFDPAEIVRVAKKNGSPTFIKKVRRMCTALESQYGRFYRRERISVKLLLKDLTPKNIAAKSHTPAETAEIKLARLRRGVS